MWPFSKKNNDSNNNDNTDNTDNKSSSSQNSKAAGTGAPKAPNAERGEKTSPRASAPESGAQSDHSPATETGSSSSSVYDSMTADTGPFDSRREDLAEFDFTDFAKGDINLGSIIVPIPHIGDIQVEVGQDGPRAVHVATPYGRLTPVAFAAPRSGGLWEQQCDEIEKQLEKDGLEVTREKGPWDTELVGTGPAGILRMIGVNSINWMLRVTAVGPKDTADKLTEVARDLVARTIVNRGDKPMPAGQTLVVALPPDMAEELKKAMAAHAAQQQAAQAGQAAPAASGSTDGNGQPNEKAEKARHTSETEAPMRTNSAMEELDSQLDGDDDNGSSEKR